VILNHLGGHPRGGFIGVDVFFVISGFLITGLLIRAASGQRSVAGYFGYFYSRRIRRILPAAVLVLATSWIAASLTFHGPRVGQSHSDILWALLFAANIHFVHIGTDYFQSSRPPSIVQHFWSLSVEEQFYVVWPIVLGAAVATLARLRRTSSSLLLWVAVAITTASFVWAMHQTGAAPGVAYFSTFDRAWELGIGAITAILLNRHPQLPRRLGRSRGPLAALGVAVVLASAFAITSNGSFPAPAAGVPVIATALIIFAGTGDGFAHPAWTWVLTNPVSYGVGALSYSLYLWHWPTIIIVGGLLTPNEGGYYPLIVIATLSLSLLSYYLVEAPIHTGARGTGRWRDAYPTTSRPGVAAGAGLAGLALAIYAITPPLPPPDFTRGPAATLTAEGGPGAGVRPSSILDAPPPIVTGITTALNARAFPHLTPGIDALGVVNARREIWAGCESTRHVPARCIFGPTDRRPADPTKRLVVIGDSIAMSWTRALATALTPAGWTVYGFTRAECPAADVEPVLQQGGAGVCDAHHAAIASAVDSIDPSVVVLTNTEGVLSELHAESDSAAASAVYEAGLEKTIHLVSAPQRRVIILSPPPKQKSLQDCASGELPPSACVTKVANQWTILSRANATVAAATSATYADTESWFCNDEDYCPAFIENVPVMYDGEHMTTFYAAKLVHPIRHLIRTVTTGP
jgi:peptidoglycan/LPS O-acetylase OafA/YrhL